MAAPRENPATAEASAVTAEKYVCDGTEQFVHIRNTCRLYKNDKQEEDTDLYLTHFNFRRVYFVMMNKDTGFVTVGTQIHFPDPLLFARPHEKELYENGSIPIVGAIPQKMWVGESPRNERTEFSGGYGPEFDGNTILLENNDECVFIGECVFLFKTKKRIVNYVSELGNNDVPYAYAVDEDENYYLLNDEKVCLQIPEDKRDDPYEYFSQIKKDGSNEYTPLNVKMMHPGFANTQIQGHMHRIK